MIMLQDVNMEGNAGWGVFFFLGGGGVTCRVSSVFNKSLLYFVLT